MLISAHSHQTQDSTSTIERWMNEAGRTGYTHSEFVGRRSDRVTWDARLTVEVFGEDGDVSYDQPACQTLFVTALDISPFGMGFRCRTELPVGAAISVILDDTEEQVRATVRKCTETVGAYLIGVEFRIAPPKEAVTRQPSLPVRGLPVPRSIRRRPSAA